MIICVNDEVYFCKKKKESMRILKSKQVYDFSTFDQPVAKYFNYRQLPI